MGRSIPCGFINLRAAVFKGLKGVLSLETPALYNGGLFPCWGCDFIWRKWLRLGEGTGHFLVWGCHKAPPLALTASVPFSNLSGGAHGLPSLASPGTLPGEVWHPLLWLEGIGALLGPGRCEWGARTRPHMWTE